MDYTCFTFLPKKFTLMYGWLLPVSLQSCPGSFIGMHVDNYTQTLGSVHYKTLCLCRDVEMPDYFKVELRWQSLLILNFPLIHSTCRSVLLWTN